MTTENSTPKLSPQQIQPLIPPTTPRDPATQRLTENGKIVGSSSPQFYDNKEDTPEYARLMQLEAKLSTFWQGVPGRLWLEEEEDPEVAAVIEEYEELISYLAQEEGAGLDFSNEIYEDEDEEQAHVED